MSKNPKITSEEIALIKSAQAGNMQAFNKLFYKYKGFTTNVLCSYIKDYDEAKDVNNIVWLKVYEKLSKFVNYSSFGGWLRVLTSRTAIDYLRELKDVTYSTDGTEAVLENSVQPDYGEKQVDKMTYDQIVEFFKKFPDNVRKVFELFYINKMTVSEISKATKIPPGTVKSHLSRKRRILKKHFKL